MKQTVPFDKRYLSPIGYVLLLTAGIPVNLAVITRDSPSFIFLLAYFLSIVLLGIVNIAQSFSAGSHQDVQRCVNVMLILKYGLVVYFLLNYIVAFTTLAAGGLIAMIASRGAAIFLLPHMLFIIGLLAFGAWLALLPSGFYGLQVVYLSYKHRKISLPAAVIHGLLQFTFVLDVLDAMYLSVKKWGMGKKSAALIGGIYVVIIGGFILASFLLFNRI